MESVPMFSNSLDAEDSFSTTRGLPEADLVLTHALFEDTFHSVKGSTSEDT